jgi:hypothetical protein
MEVSKHITFNSEWMSQYMWYTSLSQILIVIIKSHINTSCNCANLIKNILSLRMTCNNIQPQQMFPHQ